MVVSRGKKENFEKMLILMVMSGERWKNSGRDSCLNGGFKKKMKDCRKMIV